MIRKTTLNIGYANKGKLYFLNTLFGEMTLVINAFIGELWVQQDFRSKFVNFKVDTWLSARLQQCLGKQALEIAKSQRKRKKKTKPIFRGQAFNLDSRFVDFQYNNNSFDIWIRLTSLGDKLQLKLPSKMHKHYNKFIDWNKSKSIRLRKQGDQFFIDCYFEKDPPKMKTFGVVVGMDTGYKKLLIVSDNKKYDDGLENVYKKISRKKQGSKSFKCAIVERNNLINQSLNKLSLGAVKEVVCENLKNVKHKSKGKIRKKFNNKLQRWSYVKVLRKLSFMAEEAGVLLTKVNPAYTSQKCSSCGVIEKKNRKGESYQCACGNKIDADLNAAINLSHMGVYSPHTNNQDICHDFR